MTDLTVITADVTANSDAVNSAVALLNELSAQMLANATDPVAIQALADSIKANSDSLAAAVVANTPAAPPVPPVTTP